MSAAVELQKQISELISVTQNGKDMQVGMPLVYPNGESVVVTVSPHSEGLVVHDSGLGSMCLATHGVNITKNMTARLTKIAEHYGCTFSHGRMSRGSDAGDLAMAVAIVANASRSIGDHLLYVAEQPIVDFKTEALDILRKSVGKSRIRENEPVIGESGSKYTASAALLASDETTAIALIEPIRDHDAATKRFREFWDISQHAGYEHLDRYALYDDRRDWQASDLNLLQNVCHVVRLSDSKSLLG
jgi:hypothetical protein